MNKLTIHEEGNKMAGDQMIKKSLVTKLMKENNERMMIPKCKSYGRVILRKGQNGRRGCRKRWCCELSVVERVDHVSKWLEFVREFERKRCSRECK